MSLRTRLFTTYILVVVLCLALVAVVTTVLLQGQRDKLTMQRLDDMGRPISVQVLSLFRGQASAGELLDNLKEQAQQNNVYIILGDGKGDVVRQVAPGRTPRLIELPPAALPHDLTGSIQGTFVSSTGQTYIFAAYPLVRPSSTQEAAPFETIVLATARAGAWNILASLFRPVFLAGLIALFISLIIAIIFARSIYRPVNRVTAAAERIARGQYDQEIPETGPREVKGLARSFNQMTRQVKHSQQQLRHFVADVSHQLKTPLTSIQGFSQALLDGTASDEDTKLKAATIINEESNLMRRQVDELLELARMQAGHLKLSREAVNVNELLERCREILAVQAEEKGVEIKIDAEPASAVIGDADRLEQVFSNILDNALKNSPAQSRVEIAVQNLKDDAVEVRIIDSGPGIPSEQLAYVFERFYQAGGIRSGAGLGLAIAREIITAHGGTIEAQSEPGAGAEFIIRLPAGQSLSE
jgi:signal transduction histidine kinase